MSIQSLIIDCDPGVDDAVALFLAFDAAGIESRHTALPGLNGAADGVFVDDDGALLHPGARVRNDLYRGTIFPVDAVARRWIACELGWMESFIDSTRVALHETISRGTTRHA